MEILWKLCHSQIKCLNPKYKRNCPFGFGKPCMTERLFSEIAWIANFESVDRAWTLLHQLVRDPLNESSWDDMESLLHVLARACGDGTWNNSTWNSPMRLSDRTPAPLVKACRSWMTHSVKGSHHAVRVRTWDTLAHGLIRQTLPSAIIEPSVPIDKAGSWTHWEWRKAAIKTKSTIENARGDSNNRALVTTVGMANVPQYVLYFCNRYSLRTDLAQLLSRPTVIPAHSRTEIVPFPHAAEFTVWDLSRESLADEDAIAQRQCDVLDLLYQGCTIVVLNVTIQSRKWLATHMFPHFDASQFICLDATETQHDTWKTHAFLRALKRPQAAKLGHSAWFARAVELVLKESSRGLAVALNLGTNTRTSAMTPVDHKNEEYGPIDLFGQTFLIPSNTQKGAKGPKAIDDSIDSLCIVTGLFAVRDREQCQITESNGSVKSVTQYIHHAQKLLDWPVRMIVFTEPDLVQSITHEREKRGLGHCTVVVPLLLEQSRYYDALGPLKSRYALKQIPHGYCPRKDSAWYVLCCAHKFDCLERALRLHPWSQCTSYFWVDFGIYHVARPPACAGNILQVLQQWASVKRLRLAHSRTLSRTEIEPRNVYYSRLQQVTAGGVFGGPIGHVEWLVRAYEQEFATALDMYPALDEAILGALWMQFPERFAYWHASHQELLQYRPISNVLASMTEASTKQQWALVWDLHFELPNPLAVETTWKHVYTPNEWIHSRELILGCFQNLTTLKTSHKSNMHRHVLELDACKSNWPASITKRLTALCKQFGTVSASNSTT